MRNAPTNSAGGKIITPGESALALSLAGVCSASDDVGAWLIPIGYARQAIRQRKWNLRPSGMECRAVDPCPNASVWGVPQG